jgi:hypothetical protein
MYESVTKTKSEMEMDELSMQFLWFYRDSSSGKTVKSISLQF